MGSLILNVLGTLIPRIFPDKDGQERAKLELAKMSLEGELKALESEMQIALAQIKTNEEQAKSSNFFVSGARPACMWLCIIALAFSLISKLILPSALVLLPMFGISDVSNINNVIIGLNSIDTDLYMNFLIGMLGLGGLRTYEKMKGVAK